MASYAYLGEKEGGDNNGGGNGNGNGNGHGNGNGKSNSSNNNNNSNSNSNNNGDVGENRTKTHMDQMAVLDNSSDMTSLLAFHPFETALLVCDDCDVISVWNYEEARKVKSFSNSNTSGSRMTSMKIINPGGNSLLMTGCDDGTVRCWNGAVDENISGVGGVAGGGGMGGGGRATKGGGRGGRGAGASGGNSIRDGGRNGWGEREGGARGVTLASAFFGAPEMEAGKRGSGLILEWQNWSNQLITAGSSSIMRRWDLETNQCNANCETLSEACLTSLATMYDDDDNLWGGGSDGSGGIGGGGNGDACFNPNVVLGGYGDGSLRLFDLRTNNCILSFFEHNSWVVNTSFLKTRGEIVSSSVSGDLKFWDLRSHTSLRTFSVQRSPMTAMACHDTLPLMSTGSHAQFIKILSLEGQMINVIRYHEGFLGQRIGPVSCLAFHPVKFLMAAGATDSIVSLYSGDNTK